MHSDNQSYMYVPRGKGQVLQVTGGRATKIMSGVETGAAYSLWMNVTDPQRGPRPHLHHGQDEDFYILDGEVEFRCGGETIGVKEGDFVRVPHDTVHTFTVTGSAPCTMLIVLTPPGGIEGFWQEIGVPVTDLSSPPPPPGTTNFDEIAAIARKHGTEFVVSR